MNTRASSRRPSRRRTSEADSSAGKRVLTADTHVETGAPHVNIRMQDAAVRASSSVPPIDQPVGQQASRSNLLIDVEAIEDDVQMLSPSGGFPRGRNQSRMNFPVTIVLDEDPDVQTGSSGMASRGRRTVALARGEQHEVDAGVGPRSPTPHGPPTAPQGPLVPPPSSLVDYGMFMQGLVQAMQTQAQTQAALQAQLQTQAQAPPPVHQEHGGPSIMERFKRMDPPSFKGESQPLLVESWLREIEKIFRAIRCAEVDKVSLGTYMLQERADVWWSSVLRTHYADGDREVTWNEFTHLFKAKFIPEHVQDRMEQEFLTLTQGSMSVLEYEARFAELSKYAPYIMDDERRKVKKFVMGLRSSLRSRLVAFDHRTMEEAFNAACRQESVTMGDLTAVVTTNGCNKQKLPRKRTIINCETYENVDIGCKAKKKCIMNKTEPPKAPPKEPAFTCAICWGQLAEETSTICGHIFCQNCIKAAIQAQKKCPTCRRSLTMKNIHRVFLPTSK